MNGRNLQIAIAGAGPAGLAAALYLQRDGHRVTVFERFAEPRPVGSGLILQPTGLTVLDDMGLIDEIRMLGSRIDRLHGTDAASGRTVLDVRYDARPGGRFGVAVHRAVLFGTLYRAAQRVGIEVVTDVELDAVEPGGRTRLVDDKGRGLGSFDLVVDATGSRSKLRRSAGLAGEPKPLAYGAFWTSLDWRGEGFDERALSQRYRRASVMIGVLPIGRAEAEGRKMAAFFWSLKPTDAERVQADGLAAWKAQVARLWPESQAYLDQIEDFEQLTLARYGHFTLAQPAARGFAVIGDAAHSTSPQLGQGANMALLDAASLAYALRQASDVDAALASYLRARRWHVRLFQALSLVFTPFYQSDSMLLPFLRDSLVATVARIPPTPQLLASIVAGTLIDPFAPAGLEEADWTSRSDEGAARIPA
ncbi:FAD-dependent oxidoreductase [Aminobacter aganoensis]|uniref:2-polyprenyl-6-methoxyphenol hydroxylase-like FAD-dependent oxidoreductase n=1 Tax=Aminobacter aganoensis TaxID=83264 RepID=A0A7X0F4E3_9HYPH|nr:NAD(P)/FAD-dependent oxidoreductase [Aminobacter aganoensis]MBB6352896.1 2-polyprenyl-6-methoxyphenol hydroxylase-like FAD-dependent oxidoreductase [Aminobacter aganoensis]